MLIVRDICGTCVGAVHFGTEREVLGHGDVCGAAYGMRRRSLICWGERDCTLRCERFVEENVGGSVQVAEAVSAHEAFISCERSVTFENSSAKPRSCPGVLDAFFRDLESCPPTMADGEIGDSERAILAALELLLERGVSHVVDDEIWSRSKRDIVIEFRNLGLGLGVACEPRSSLGDIYDKGHNGQAREN